MSIFLVEMASVKVADGTSKTWCFGTSGYAIGSNFYEPRVNNPGTLAISMFSAGKTSGETQIGYGEVVFNNEDGGLDSLLDYSFDGRTITLKEVLATGTIITLMACSMEQPVFTDNEMSIRIRDPQLILNVPIQTNKYAGSNVLPNGVEGTNDLQGKPKPLVFGQASNISPVLVNTSKLVYQIHESAVTDIPAVRDKGVDLVRGADYASQADMLANPPAAGNYRAWLGGGMFRLGSSSIGQVTCDAIEGATADDRTAAQIVRRIVKRSQITPGVYLSDSNLNLAGFTSLDGLDSGVKGIYINAETTIIPILDEIMAPGGWYGFDTSGLFNVGRLDAPSGAPAFTIGAAEIKSLERQTTQDEGKGLPVWAINLNYDKNYTIQTTDLAASITSLSPWIPGQLPSALGEPMIAYGNGMFVAVSANVSAASNVAATSPDGIIWTQRTLPAMANWSRIAYGNGLFVAIAFGGNVAATSPDGVTWTQRTLPVSGYCIGIIYGNGLFVVLSDSVNYSLTSPDGITWTQRTLPASTNWGPITFGGGQFIALASGQAIAASSPDGITWTQRTLPSADWSSIIYGNGVFVAIDQSTNGIYATSPDGITWTQRILPSTEQILWSNIAYGDGYFVAIGIGVSAISLDGISWQILNMPEHPPLSYSWTHVVFGNGMFIASNYDTPATTAILRVTPAELRRVYDWYQFRTITSSDASVVAIHLLAVAVNFDSLYAFENDAQNESDRQLALRKVRRDYLKATLDKNSIPAIPFIGVVIQITYPRYGYDNGKLFIVIGVERDHSTGLIILDLWG